MLGDLLKLFTKEPDKLQRLAVGFLKTILTIVFGAFLYKTFVGPFQENLPSSFNGWLDYFSNGHLLLYLFMLAIGYFLLFELATSLFSLIIYLLGIVARKLLKLKDDEQRFVLKLFDVLRFSKDGTDVQPGSNIDVIYNLSKSFENPEENELSDIIGKSTYADICSIYIAFAVIYYTCLTGLNGFKNISWLVIATVVLITLSTVALGNAIKYMQRHYKNLVAGLSFVKIRAVFEEVFQELGITASDSVGIKNLYEFEYNKKKYRIYGRLYILPHVKEYNRFKRFAQESKKTYFIALASEHFKISTDTHIDSNNNYAVIVYKDNEQFKEALINMLTMQSQNTSGVIPVINN
jgi:hypothetical protein